MLLNEITILFDYRSKKNDVCFKVVSFISYRTLYFILIFYKLLEFRMIISLFDVLHILNIHDLIVWYLDVKNDNNQLAFLSSVVFNAVTLPA